MRKFGDYVESKWIERWLNKCVLLFLVSLLSPPLLLGRGRPASERQEERSADVLFLSRSESVRHELGVDLDPHGHGVKKFVGCSDKVFEHFTLSGDQCVSPPTLLSRV